MAKLLGPIASSEFWILFQDSGPENDWLLPSRSIKGIEIVNHDPPELHIVTHLDSSEGKTAPPNSVPKKITVIGNDARVLYDSLMKLRRIEFVGIGWDQDS